MAAPRFDLAWDGHTHSEFCPHGSLEDTEGFVRAAIAKGFRRYSITEHYPLPEDFPDPTPDRSSSMAHDQVEPYLERVRSLKAMYADQIEILVGFEWDYLPAHEDYTRAEIAKWADQLDDGILSVHFVGEALLDYSPESFLETLAEPLGGVEAAHRAYYQAALQGIKADLGPHGPRRLGHLNVIRKFIQACPLPADADFTEELTAILDALEERGWALDYNVAGLLKPHCGEVYVPDALVEQLVREGSEIPLVYGSDTHSVKGVGQKHEVYRAIAARFGEAP